jgi:hypothetical protein
MRTLNYLVSVKDLGDILPQVNAKANTKKPRALSDILNIQVKGVDRFNKDREMMMDALVTVWIPESDFEAALPNSY